MTANLIGTKRHMLTVQIYHPGSKRKGNPVVKNSVTCLCDCGRTTKLDYQNFIRGKQKSCGCLRRKGDTVDENKFKEITTPDDAYWLGMMYTDGCVTDKGSVILGLKEGDKDHVKKFAVFMGSKRDPKMETRESGEINGKPIKKTVLSRVTIGSKNVCRNLTAHGIHPRKTWSIRPWQGPEHLMPHFWRGCVDGDGSVLCTEKTIKVTLCGNSFMVAGFREFIRSRLGFDGHLETWITERQEQIQSGNLYSDFQIATVPRCKAVVRLLGYEDQSNTSLDRKRQSAIKILTRTERNGIGNVGRDELIDAFKRLGSWMAVASEYCVADGVVVNRANHFKITEDEISPYRKRKPRVASDTITASLHELASARARLKTWPRVAKELGISSVALNRRLHKLRHHQD